MKKEAREVEDFFNKATQIWTILEEDEKVQQWDQKEERINTAIQELKQQKKTMRITECLKGTQEMKNLQTELKTMQTKKQERQACYCTICTFPKPKESGCNIGVTGRDLSLSP
jgi:hypothetical protein